MKYRDHFDKELFCRKILAAKASTGSADAALLDLNRINSAVDTSSETAPDKVDSEIASNNSDISNAINNRNDVGN